jgi:integrase
MPKANRYVPTPQEVKKMLTIAKDKDLQDYIFLLLAAETGARLEELLEVKVRDIDFNLARPFITLKTLKRKDNQTHTRQMPVRQKVLRDLEVYIRSRKLKRNDRLFTKTRRRFQQLVKHYAKVAGVEAYRDITPHSFRDFFITEMRRRSWTYEDISKLTGHADIKSLQRVYDHTDVYDVENKFRRMSLLDLD